MDETKPQAMQESSNVDQPSVSSVSKKPWQAPKLVFVEPTLTKQGELTEVTGQFFGAFSP